MMPVTVYSSQLCPYCVMAKRLLERKGISYAEIHVDSDTGVREQMVARSGRRTVPQIFIGERHVGGFQELAAADRDGRLDAWLHGGAV